MIPPRLEYHRPESVEAALELLAADPESTRPLAGGQSLVPALKTGGLPAGRSTPDVLVDLGDLEELRSIDADGDETVLGALTTYAEIADSDVVRTRSRAVAEAARAVGDRQVRNRGTIGGNLAQADPDGDLPAAALAADARIDVRGPDGERTVGAADFVRGPNETALEPVELVTAVRLPQAVDSVAGTGEAYVRKTHPASGYAMVGVAAGLEIGDDGTIAAARLGTTGVTERAIRLRAVERALVDEPVTGDVLETAAGAVADDLESVPLQSDAHASGAYRAHLLPAYVERALSVAAGRATEGEGGSDGGERR